MSSRNAVFTSDNVLIYGSDETRPATIVVDTITGKIIRVDKARGCREDFPDVTDDHWFDAEHKMILPGLVDAHVHLNEPGRSHWEGFESGTLAAASGGVTTIVDMPLNSIPPTTTVENLRVKRAAAEGKCWVDVAFWGGLVPDNKSALKDMVDAGAKGFKCFLIDSGVDEFPYVTELEVETAMEHLGNSPVPLLFHAELESENHHAEAPSGSDPTLYQTFLQSRPEVLETDAISLILRLQEKHSYRRCHIVHLSAASALPAIREAKAKGLPLTVETCFHYLVLAAEDIPDGDPRYKCCPPVRGEDNRNKLWDALLDGTIDCVVSDHSPCTQELKRVHGHDGNIMKAWGGISTLGLGLSLLWTEAQKRGIGIGQICKWTSERTAKLASLDHRKGGIKEGLDADIIFWDVEAEDMISNAHLHFKNKHSLYEGKVIRGRVEKTFIRGLLVWDRVNGKGAEHLGQFL